MNPKVFELTVSASSIVGPGRGLLAAYVPATAGMQAVVALTGDPRYPPGRDVAELAPAAIGWLAGELGAGAAEAVWAIIDDLGRYRQALPGKVGPGGTAAPAPSVEFRDFPDGRDVAAFYKDVGAPAEAAVELISTALNMPSRDAATPSATAFLDAVEAYGRLPAPGVVFRKVSTAAAEGDARAIAAAIQPDPVLAASLINYANAARFAAGGKTASVPQAVSRLGTSFVKHVVFVAEMVARYRTGACPAFDYRAFWLNGIAAGAAMRALLPEAGLPPSRADEAFTTGLVSGIGWLVVAESHPALMQRYLERCRDADPIAKAHAQREIFPSEICQVTERYLRRFDFPEAIQATIAGRADVDRQWYDLLARAVRIAQALAPFACLAIPTTIPVPPACREEWARWQEFVAAMR